MQNFWKDRPISDFILTHNIYDKLVCEMPCNVTNITMEGSCSVGAFSYSNYQTVISNTSIGRFCSIGQQCLIGPGNHNLEFATTHPIASDPSGASCGMVGLPHFEAVAGTEMSSEGRVRDGRVTIGNDVWIGCRAIVLGGVRIGDGAVIAAGAVVTSDVEPYTIFGGIPAIPIRNRFDDELVKRFLKILWWNFDLSGLTSPRDCSNPHLFLNRIEHLINSKELSKARYERALVQNGILRMLSDTDESQIV